jgi:hypothetical protein
VKDKPSSSLVAPAGLSITEWCRQVGIAPSTYYLIAKAMRPRHLRCGRRILVIESARAWLERMASYGRVPTEKPGDATLGSQ